MLLRELTTPIILLLDDAQEAEHILENNDSQFNRRSYIRCIFSSIEGVLFLLKKTCLRIVKASNNSIKVSEYCLLIEKDFKIKNNGDVQIQDKFIPLADNLRFTIRIVNNLYNSNIDLETGTKNWEDFLSSIKVRNRITHPKRTDDLNITDLEISSCKNAVSWFNCVTLEFVKTITNKPQNAKQSK